MRGDGRSPWTNLLLGVVGALAAAGCAPSDEPAWAMQHGSALVTADGLEGYQVWDFFGKRWARKKADKHHVCARVQTLVGLPSKALSGCAGCSATYAVRTDELETDCAGDVATGAGYGSVTHFAFGPVPGEISADNPYPGQALGWYVSFDGQRLEPMGFLWNERVEHGEPPDETGLAEGERFVFWPAYTWSL